MSEHRSRRILVAGFAALVALAASAAGDPETAGIEAQAAFERLKGLAGTWHGEPEAVSETGEPIVFETRVSANGTVVQETMFPGTPNEMINMYHLDGEELQLTHYCAGGNQPQMRLDRAASSAGELRFEFAGATNLDPATEVHIHAARLVWREDGRLESRWTGWSGGAEAGQMVFLLSRAED